MNEMLLLHSIVSEKKSDNPLTECQVQVLDESTGYADTIERVVAEIRQLQPGETITMIIPVGQGISEKMKELIRRTV